MQTHITFTNPENPETDASYADDETMQEHFDAAMSIKRSQIDRRIITGDFLVAVSEELNDPESNAIREFFERIQE